MVAHDALGQRASSPLRSRRALAADRCGCSKNRGLLSVMRRTRPTTIWSKAAKLVRCLEQHPALAILHEFRERLCRLLLLRRQTAKACRHVGPVLLNLIDQWWDSGFAELQSLGQTLYSWKQEVARMFHQEQWHHRGFNAKMEVLQRPAYGFRNFQNYRLPSW